MSKTLTYIGLGTAGALVIGVAVAVAQTYGTYQGNTPDQRLMYWTEQQLTSSEQDQILGMLQAVRTQLEDWKSGNRSAYVSTLAQVSTYFASWTPTVATVTNGSANAIFDNESIYDYEIHQPVHVNIFGNTAVIAFAVDLEPKRQTPGPLYQPSKITSIWHLENGAWHNLHTHLSPLVDRKARVATALPATFGVAPPDGSVIPITTEQPLSSDQLATANLGVNFARSHWDAWKQQDGTFFTNNLGSMGTYYGPWTPNLQVHDSSTFATHYPQTYSQVKILDYNMNPPIHVNVYDNLAILAYNVDVKMSKFGNYTSQITHIAANFDGGWHMVHAHESRVAVYK